MRLRISVSLSIALQLACSDDGVPQSDATDPSASAGSTSGDPSGPTTTTTASTSASTDMTATTVDTTASTDPSSTGLDSSGTGDTTNASTGPDATSSESSSTGGEPAGECSMDGDCTLVDDCCTCAAIGPDEDPPACDIDECDQTACTAFGGSSAICELGSCEIAEVPCDPTLVGPECKISEPECDDGMLPSVDPIGGCWTGGCAPVDACDVVPDCASCPADEACIEQVTHFGPRYSCTPIDPSCPGFASCACMGDAVCISPFDTCTDAGGGLSCSCPVC